MSKPEKRPATPEIVKGIADVSGLGIDQERAVELASQVQSMRDSINAMDKLDLTGVEPATVLFLAP